MIAPRPVGVPIGGADVATVFRRLHHAVHIPGEMREVRLSDRHAVGPYVDSDDRLLAGKRVSDFHLPGIILT